MLLGYNTNGFAHHTLPDTLIVLGELGYRSVAITLDHHVLSPAQNATWSTGIEMTRNHLEPYGMRCVIETGARFYLDIWRKHQPTLLKNDNAHSMSVREKSIALAHQLSADAVSFWSGTDLESTDESTLWNRLTTSCQQLCKYAEQHNVRLAFEPEPGMFIDTMDRFEELVNRVQHPLFGLTLDVGHLHCLGETPIASHIHRWRDLLWNVHIEDMKAGVHDHLMFGEGEMSFPPIFEALREIDYRGGIHVELSRHSHNAVETARTALQFLRSL